MGGNEFASLKMRKFAIHASFFMGEACECTYLLNDIRTQNNHNLLCALFGGVQTREFIKCTNNLHNCIVFLSYQSSIA